MCGLRLPICLLFVGLLSSGCSQRPNEASDFISGRVLMDGKPVPRATVYAVAEGKPEVSAQTTLDGKYILSGPPLGKLQFKVEDSVSAIPGIPHVPAKYNQYDSGLTFEYTGGRQTFEIKLTP